MLFTAGHGAGQLVFAFAQTGEDVEHLLHVVGNAHAVVPNVSAHLQVLDNRHAREHTTTFGHHGQALLDQVPRTLTFDALAQILDVTTLHRQRARDGLHGRGLARAVGADQRNQFALVDFHVHALDGLDAAISHFQAFDFQ